MNLILGTRRLSILRFMRKSFVLSVCAIVLLVLAVPIAGLSALDAGEGTLSVEDGRGTVTMKARGGLIGRLDRGSVTIYDLTPEDASDPVVFGDDEPVELVGETGIRYSGIGLRYRLIGGSFRVVVSGRGIDLSAVGKGTGTIRGELEEPGLYSLDGVDCRKASERCKPLPERVQRFQLGAEQKPAPNPS